MDTENKYYGFELILIVVFALFTSIFLIGLVVIFSNQYVHGFKKLT